MSDGLFNEQIAADYDTSCGAMNEPAAIEPAVDFLYQLSAGGRALEFAIGTGRIALPLRQRGIEVHGNELSQAMVRQLRAKPGGDQIPVTIGDMASSQSDGQFKLVYLVYNTITNLLTQDEQVDCFCNAAAHLEVGGYFVIEVGLPEIRRLLPGHSQVLFDATSEHVGYDQYDLVNQMQVSHHVWTNDNDVRTFQSAHRYAWPAEYDLMARIARLNLTQRWSDWHRSPFSQESTAHVSVWQRQS